MTFKARQKRTKKREHRHDESEMPETPKRVFDPFPKFLKLPGQIQKVLCPKRGCCPLTGVGC